ncbi:MAG: T9SS type A sorting domain-containing protein [Ferruginibacter sp.]|nr:T9SS type A sorting domain-containing protein [Ferruginibacter sp.]
MKTALPFFRTVSQHPKFTLANFLLPALFLFATYTAGAATRTWIGYGAGGTSLKTDIAAPANWNGGTPLLSTDDYVMIFSGTLGSNSSFNTFVLSQSAVLTFKSLTVSFNGNGFAQKTVVINISKNLGITNLLTITNSTTGNADHEIDFNITAGTVTCGSVALNATGNGGFFGFPQLYLNVSNGASLISSGALAAGSASSSFTTASVENAGTVTVNGVTTANSSGFSQIYFDANNGSVFNFNGAVSLGTSGLTGVFLSTVNLGTSTGKFYFRNNLSFGSLGFIDPLYSPQSYTFDAAVTQALSLGNSNIYFSNLLIGDVNSPNVNVTGTGNASLTSNASSANLLLSNSAVLNLGVKTLNRTAAGGSLTLTGSSALKLAGTTGGQTGSNFPLNFNTINLGINSTVEYNGANGSTQTVYAPPSYGSLSLSNSSGSGTAIKNITANAITRNTLSLNDKISFTIPSGKSVTLKSDASITARIAEIITPASVALIYGGAGSTKGKFIVERYISAVKGWRFLAVPTNGAEFIHDAWQEGQSANNTSLAGKGIQLTSNLFPNGFDLYTSTSALKTYVPVTNSWAGVPSTLAPFDNSKGGYMTFIRGDRTVNGYAQAATATVLRTSGDIYKGDVSNALTTSGQLRAISNPYASAVDFTKIYLNSTGISELFYVYDPKAGTPGLGGYQTISKIAGVWKAIPGGGSYPLSGPVDPYIESGQAFLVYSTSNSGSLAFKENEKVTTSNLVSRNAANNFQAQGLQTRIYTVNGDSSSLLLDGVYNDFNADFSSTVDELDAKKSKNFGFNLALSRGNELLVVDKSQPLADKDTIFLSLTGVKVQRYRFEFTADNLAAEGFEAYLEDAYLQTRKEIDLTSITRVDFSISNIPGSYAPNRFRIVFVKMLLPLPLRFISIAASHDSEEGIKIDWKVKNESNINYYDIEHSVDGKKFTVICKHLPNDNNGNIATYTTNDGKPLTTDNFYRIKAVGKNSRIVYSSAVKVDMVKVSASVSIYPNPLVGKTVNIRFQNQAAGEYSVRLNNMQGQVVYAGIVSINGPVVLRSVVLDDQLSSGHYQLIITSENGTKTIQQLIIR